MPWGRAVSAVLDSSLLSRNHYGLSVKLSYSLHLKCDISGLFLYLIQAYSSVHCSHGIFPKIRPFAY